MIQAYISDLVPVTMDEEGVVYTQLIICKHSSGLKFSIFDPRMLCKNDDIDKDMRLDIRVPISSSIEHSDKTEFIIKPFIDGGGLINPTADINGIIEDITWSYGTEGYPYAILNVGIGTLKVMLDKIGEENIFKDKSRLKIYKKGEYIFIKYGQFYLDRIVIKY